MQYSLGKKRELLGAWKEARRRGVLQAEFCREHGLPQRTLRAWMRADDPGERGSIGKAEHILRDAAKRLVELADSLVLDETGTAETENPIEGGLAGDGSLEGMPTEGGTPADEEVPQDGVSEAAAVAPAGGEAQDIGSESTPSAAAPPAEEARPVEQGLQWSKRNCICWNFEE